MFIVFVWSMNECSLRHGANADQSTQPTPKNNWADVDRYASVCPALPTSRCSARSGCSLDGIAHARKGCCRLKAWPCRSRSLAGYWYSNGIGKGVRLPQSDEVDTST